MSSTASLIEQHPQELNGSELSDLVSCFIEDREIFLSACLEHGSPLYVFEPEVLSSRAEKFTSAFRKELPDIGVYYAIKSNNHPIVAQTLVEHGLGLDVSSGLELQIALDTGTGDIVFSGPGKAEHELTLAVEHNQRVTILLDSFAELERLQEIASSLNKSVRAGIRVMTRKHGIWRKFGIPLSDLPGFLDKAETCDHVQVRGLQSHVSWNLNPCRQVEFIQTLGAMLGNMTEHHRNQIEFVDIGGGIWPPQGEWLHEAAVPEDQRQHVTSTPENPPFRHIKQPACSIEAFASAIGDAVRSHIFHHITCRICLEPGRWLCNDAMHILVTVIDKKEEDLLITDAGTNAIGRERFETDYFPVINLSRPGTTEHKCLVMGSLCTPHDIWGYTYHGQSVEPGDILLIPHQGAYTYSLRQEFIKPLPEVTCVSVPSHDRRKHGVSSKE